ncbi:tRNA 4-thiouridine(8) synthase ThiI [Deferribacter thermophilus]|uniref:tRNA uracil 4-sulfurtransferase ThiI n=1 Tax=Deferribacter thermophilus TaxID=53573 RepID=UPI003C2169CB
MKKILVFNYSEISLKKKNRKFFEDKLYHHINNIAKHFNLGKTWFIRGRFYLEIYNESQLQKSLEYFEKIFGIQSIFLGYKTDKDFDKICLAAKALTTEKKGVKTFKINAKRADKSFPINSMEINRELGGYILDNYPELTVDVHNPDMEIIVEIHKNFSFIMTKIIDCIGGLPYGSAGKVVSLLSGGIDSPVATWLMMKRGCEVVPLHFYTPPYTGNKLTDKIERLVKTLSLYSVNGITLYMINFTQIQIAIKKYAHDKFTTILSRRFMLKIANEIATNLNALGIITGDALGQVASQTLENLYCVNEASNLPVFRPLIGFDKQEIENLAKKIGTYPISIEEGIDCCHLFSPKNPETRGKIDMVKEEEEKVLKALNYDLPFEVETKHLTPF